MIVIFNWNWDWNLVSTQDQRAGVSAASFHVLQINITVFRSFGGRDGWRYFPASLVAVHCWSEGSQCHSSLSSMSPQISPSDNVDVSSDLFFWQPEFSSSVILKFPASQIWKTLKFSPDLTLMKILLYYCLVCPYWNWPEWRYIYKLSSCTQIFATPGKYLVGSLVAENNTRRKGSTCSWLCSVSVQFSAYLVELRDVNPLKWTWEKVIE